MNVYSKFETELAVRPDDIDLYQHVHSTRYLDYVLAARFDQMERCYGMPIHAFGQRGLGWFMASASLHFKRTLGLGDRMVVRTWIDRFAADGCRVAFEIDKLPPPEVARCFSPRPEPHTPSARTRAKASRYLLRCARFAGCPRIPLR